MTASKIEVQFKKAHLIEGEKALHRLNKADYERLTLGSDTSIISREDLRLKIT